MTLSSTTSRARYAGNGATTAFAFPYYFLDEDDLTVVLTASDGTEETQVIVTDYTVSGEGNPAGGTVTMNSAPASGEYLTILRQVDLTQATDWVDNDPLPASSIENAMDKITMAVQQVDEEVGRALRFLSGSSNVDIFIEEAPVAGAVLQWNADADGIENGPDAQELADALTDAETAATNAAASASAAASSASSASSSATAASGSASAAAASAVAAAASAASVSLSWQGQWLTATVYVNGNLVFNDGSGYICILDHTSGASTEPGTGASWQTYWDLFAQQGSAGAGTGDMLAANNLSDVSSAATAFANIKQAASDTATGVVELATNAETQTGTDANRAVTPAGLASVTATETRAGLVELATTAEATTGTDTARAVTPAGVVAAIAATGAPSAATQAQQEAGSATNVYTTPGRQHYHPSAAKFWADVSQSTGAPSLSTSYNVTSITDSGVGDLTITIATDFSSANWCCVASIEGIAPDSTSEPNSVIISGGDKAAGTVVIKMYVDDQGGSPIAGDPSHGWQVVGFGDHA